VRKATRNFHGVAQKDTPGMPLLQVELDPAAKTVQSALEGKSFLASTTSQQSFQT
jgi:hypothetical protein